MKTKAIMILGMIALCTVTSCRCDFDEDEPKNRDKDRESQAFRPQPFSENDTILLKR